MLFKTALVENFACAETGSRHFRHVGGADSLFRRADFSGGIGGVFIERVELLVPRHDELAARGKLDAGEIDAAFRERLHLLHESDGIDNDAVCDDAVRPLVENSGRNQMKYEFFPAVFHGVARVVPALKTDDHIDGFRKNVDDFPFAFVAPL